MESAAKARPKKKSIRKDPKPRQVDGGVGWTRLRNRDPNKHYVYVNSNDANMGPDYYEDMGYVVETLEEGGVRPASARTVKNMGDEIEMRGHLLMSCSNERHREIQQKGADGDSGWDLSELYEQQMIGKRGGTDLFRGIHRMGAENGFALQIENENK
jgi:hypothetical protein